ncbi:MAG: hypothetical protein M1299_11815 [Firmicutes bacterium]|nr:hypothetical protein [Bacillota bacterium]MCL5040485.1 hypothetical protein [Bacillota bacterium]
MIPVFLFFIDGFGIGEPDPGKNPFLKARLPALTQLWGHQPGVRPSPGWGRIPLFTPENPPEINPEKKGWPSALSRGLGTVYATDARLGVPGLPQSATGQVTIFTGQNAARFMGEHINGRPAGQLADLLTRDNIYTRAVQAGWRATFLNAYRPEFFQYFHSDNPRIPKEVARLARAVVMAAGSKEVSLLRSSQEDHPSGEGGATGAKKGMLLEDNSKVDSEEKVFPQKRYRPSVTTLAVASAGLPFRSFDDLEAGQAVYQDITHWTLQGRYPVEPIPPQEAGRRAARLAKGFDLAVFEHFWTDRAGHSGEMAEAIRILEILDGFLQGLLEVIDLSTSLLIITSDHGNIEDLSTGTHTANPVPTIIAGPQEVIPAEVPDLTHIAPLIGRCLGLLRESH